MTRSMRPSDESPLLSHLHPTVGGSGSNVMVAFILPLISSMDKSWLRKLRYNQESLEIRNLIRTDMLGINGSLNTMQ
ncbi:hypothetical protein E2562_006482 [Oryza meyeriana var. granulata]|uniref:Uncharacterized protein n=1 Tax=Oryza meyeriana var. granulata TaxID=110450 RepID=A0A6G1CMJ9_9ORYZ|nr:hypothetical protein E2562_006482 [Oryza meyeriana var. granulata]